MQPLEGGIITPTGNEATGIGVKANANNIYDLPDLLLLSRNMKKEKPLWCQVPLSGCLYHPGHIVSK